MLAWLTICASAFYALFFLFSLVKRRKRQNLDDTVFTGVPRWPKVALIFSTRGDDETSSVRGASAAASMLALDYPNLEIIPVCDRGKSQHIDRMKSQAPSKVSVVQVDSLPAGWLGKTNALQRAAATTDAEWLLFTDSDVCFEPQTIKRALALLFAENADHLTVSPGWVYGPFWGRVFMNSFNLLLLMGKPPSLVASQKFSVHMGFGAFNMVRKTAFDAIGGFDSIRMSIDEDIKLGRALKWAGFSSRLAYSRTTVRVAWHQGVRDLLRGVEKNIFANVDFSVIRALLMIFVYGFGAVPVIGLVCLSGLEQGIAALGTASLMGVLWLARESTGLGAWYGLSVPIGSLFLSIAMVRSAALAFLRKGIVWRKTFYSLGDLKAHVIERDRIHGDNRARRRYWF